MRSQRKLRSRVNARRRFTFRPQFETLEKRLTPDANNPTAAPLSYIGAEPPDVASNPTAHLTWLLAHGDAYQPGQPGADADLNARVAAILNSQNQNASNDFTTIVTPGGLGGGGPDPGAPGTFSVSTQDYNLGDQVFHPASLGTGAFVELTARVYSPTDLQGERPLLIFLHGNHAATYNPTTFAAGFAWPPSASGPGFVALPNYQGYDYIGQNLASHGYIVVSISADGVNVLGGINMVPRAQLVERTLDLVHDLDTGTGTIMPETNAQIGSDQLPSSGLTPFGTQFVGHIDLQTVGLMGHSRGGDGVVAAYQLNQQLGSPYGIKAVAPLSPVDFTSRTINNVPLMVMYGYNDGDVSDLEGEGFYDRSRYNVAGDQAPKHIVLVQGANHNSFNTIWWAEPAIRFPAGASDDGVGSAASRLSPPQQRSVAIAYFGAFFQTYVGNDTQPVHHEFYSFLTGDSPPPASVDPAAQNGIFFTYHPADTANARRDVNRLLTPDNLTTNTVGGAVTQSGLTPYTVAAFSGTPASFAGTGIPTLQVLRAGWSAPGAFWENDLPAGSRDVSGYYALQFRAAVDYADSRNPSGQPQNFQITLTDGQGNTASATVNDAYQGRPSPLYFPPLSRHRVMNSVRIPLSLFSGLDLTDVRSIRFNFNQTASGALWFADLMFANRSLALSVTSSSPGAGQVITTQPTDFVVHFSAPYDPTSVTAGAFTVTPPGGSPMPATSFTLTDPTTITFSYAASPVTAEGGPYAINIAAGAIHSTTGDLLEAYTANFRYSTLRLQVDSTNPPTGSVVLLPFTTLDVHFTRTFNAAAVSPSTLTINQGHVTDATLLPDNQTIRYTLSGITHEGTLTAMIGAGVFTDSAGNPNVAFSGSYFLDFGPLYPFPTPLQAVLPLGSLVYQGSLTSAIANAADSDSFTIPVDAGQTITIVVRPAAGFQPTVDLSQGGTSLRSGVAGAPGQAVVLQTYLTPGSLGDGSSPLTYTITLGGTNGTSGAYSVQVVLNAVLDDLSNGSQNTAQDLDSAFLSGRAAVVGMAHSDQQWYQFSLAAGQSSTLVLSGPAHVALVNAAGNILATSHTAGNVRDIISDFIAPATGTYYAVVGGTGTGAYNLVVTRNGEFDTEPNSTPATAQDVLSAGPGGTQYVFGNVGQTGVSGGSAHVLYFNDVAQSGSDPYLTAFAALGITPTIVPQATISDPSTAYAAFTADLQAGGWDLVVFQQRYWSSGDFPSFSWISPFLSYINNGGHVIYSTWVRTQIFTDPTVAALYAALDATTTGNNNQTVVNQIAASPIWEGIPNPLNLTLNGTIGTSTIGLRAATGGTAIGRYANGEDALIIGNNGNTILSGFMPYLASSAAATQLVENELGVLLARPDPTDFYKVTLAAGQTVQVQALLPGTPGSAMADGLDLQLRLYSPSGELLGAVDDGVQMSYRVPAGQGGTYYIEVLPSPRAPAPTQGDFVLSVETTSGVLAPFVVTGSNPSDGTFIQRGAVPTTITVSFNHNIDLSTLQASDLTLDGISATGFTVVSGNTVSFNVVGGLSNGTHVVHIAAGAIRDIEGSGLQDFTSTFIVDLTPPRVIGSSVQEGDIVTSGSGGSFSYTVTFNRSMKTAGVTSSAFSLVGTLGTRTATSFSFNADGTALTINYTNLPEDSYTLTLFSSSFVSLAGWQLDGETTVGGVSVWPIPPGQSGDGVEGGNFVVHFSTNVPISAYPLPLQQGLPQGSLIYSGTPVTAFINPADDTDSYTINLDPGQTLTVLVHPNSATLQPAVQVTDPSGTSIGSATAPAAGAEVVLQTVAITTPGTYTITVSGAAGTGSFRVQAFLNTALEGSAHGGPADDTIATAQDLTGSFTPLTQDATRGAVIGHANAGGYQATAVTPTFEDISTTGHGVLQGTNDSVIQLMPSDLNGFQFTFYGHTYNTVYFNTNALINFTTADTAFFNTDLTSSPTEACIAPLWTDYVAFDPSSVVYWQVLGTGSTQHLVLEWKNVQFYPGGTSPFLTFEAVLNADGSMQFNYLDVNNATRGTAGIKDAGTQGPNRLLLAFNNGPNQFVGNNLSTRIASTAATPSYFSFTVDHDERVTLALKGLGAAGLNLQLQNESGTTLATGVSAANLDQVINRYLLTQGTYYARISGQASGDYSLVVTRDADFDTEPNGTLATAQSIDGVVGTLGYVASSGNTTGARVLYFVDGLAGSSDPFRTALTNLGITPTVASGFGDFDTRVATGSWDLVIFINQDFDDRSWVTPLVNYVTGGGRAIVALWTRQPFGGPIAEVQTAAAALGGQYTGSINLNPITQTVTTSPIWAGISNPFSLINPGWLEYSSGIMATTGQAIGTFPNGDAAVIVGNSGRTILNGFASETPASAAQGVQLYQNEIVSMFGGLDDYYAATATEGEMLHYYTITPGDGPGGFGNTLSLHLQLFDPNGNVVAEGVKLADGRNEQINYTVPAGAAGVYVIRVTAENGTRGEYFLDPIEIRPVSTAPVPPSAVFATNGAAVAPGGVKAVLGGTQADVALSYTAAPLSSHLAASTPAPNAGAAATIANGSPTLFEVLSPRVSSSVDTRGGSGAVVSSPDGQGGEPADAFAGLYQSPAVSFSTIGDAMVPAARWRHASDTYFAERVASADDQAADGAALLSGDDRLNAALDSGAALAAVVALGGYWHQTPEERDPRKRWTLRR
jgi:hypothetical protein